MRRAVDRSGHGDRRALGALIVIVLAVGLASISTLSIMTGAISIPLPRILYALAQGWLVPAMPGYETDRIVLYTIRIPRTLAGALVGGGLAVSGAMMQGLFRNPLADPGLVGVSSGAALGATISIVLAGSLTLLQPIGIALTPAAAFLGGLCSTLLLYAAATRKGRTSTATMLLAGLGLGALAGAMTGFIVYLSNDEQLRDLTYWFMGGLGGATWRQLAVSAPFILMLFCVAPFLSRGLDALILGEATARHLGIDVQFVKSMLIVTVALAVGASVALSGVVGFVGIVVPHILRQVIGPEHRYLLPASALFGACLVISADMLCRTIVAPAELPLGILTAAIGAPVFLFILLRGRTLVEL